ncbi:MAG TPA: phosphodiester glycosidase family protein [bacterium]|nr:phosphodiester glycosidase family protein [bacterium]
MLLALFASRVWALDYRPLEKGLDYATLQTEAGAKIHVLKVDLKRFDAKVIDARDLKSSTLAVKTLAEKSKALAAINANFFDAEGKPLGLVLQNGKLKNPPKRISWWASLLLKDGSIQIEKNVGAERSLQFQNGIQAGPRLVVNGRTLKLKEEFSPKSAVGIDRQGRLVLIATEGGIEINQFAGWLAKKEKAGGIGLWQALNLDGGSSTQFFAKAGDLELWISGLAKVPVALGIFRK